MPSSTVFRPTASAGALIGGVVALACLGLAVALLYRGLTLDVSLNQLWPFLLGALFLVLGLLFGYWTWSCLSLRYIVDRNALVIRWGALKQIVPIEKIERLIPAAAESDSPSIEGIEWPGHHVGNAEIDPFGRVLFYSTHRGMGDVLYVQTPDEVYAISVPDQIAFAQAVQENKRRGPLFEQRQEVQRIGISAQAFWLDPFARLLTVGLIAAFVMAVGYVLEIYPGLDQSVPLRFPSLGGIVRVSDKSELLDIPRSAAAFLAINLGLAIVLHTWERMVSYVLLLAGIVLQVTLLVAAIVAVA